ncbi:MAG: hypothetical protein ACRDPC_04905 [Solirubrobacteraceae bacterium]
MQGTTVTASSPPAHRRLPAALPVLLAGVPVLAVVLLVHGLLPGLVNDGSWNYLLEGDMRCLRNMGLEALSSWCNWYGMPLGYPFLNSGPIVWLGWALMYGTGMGSYPAYLLSVGAFHAIALAGGYGLMRCLRAGRAVALAASAAYLIAPTVVGMAGFGGTFTGYALLPAYALADLVAMQLIGRGDRRLIAAALIGYAAVKTGALFMDGYSFVVSGLLSTALWLQWAIREPLPVPRRALGIATLLSGHLAAFALYSLYTPSYSSPMPLDFMRSMGLDVVTLVQPTSLVWAPDALGLATEHTDLWGDGSNATYNYVGFACLVLAGAALVTRFRERHVAALAAAGAIALVLSLGPSLKIDDVRPTPAGMPTFESYLMPAGAAAVDFPWGGLFTDLPGVEEMRAAYRWNGLARLALIFLAALAIDRLARQPRRRVLAGVLAAVAVIEIAPNVPRLYDGYRDNYEDRAAFNRDVTPDLLATTERGERVFFLSPDGSYADYLANYMAPTMEVRALNAGGDKNSALAQASWPPEVAVMANPARTPDDVHAALSSGSVGVVVAPYFHLRWSTYSWPPAPQEREATRRTLTPILEDPRFEVRRYPWFATVRLSNR